MNNLRKLAALAASAALMLSVAGCTVEDDDPDVVPGGGTTNVEIEDRTPDVTVNDPPDINIDARPEPSSTTTGGSGTPTSSGG